MFKKSTLLCLIAMNNLEISKACGPKSIILFPVEDENIYRQSQNRLYRVKEKHISKSSKHHETESFVSAHTCEMTTSILDKFRTH